MFLFVFLMFLILTLLQNRISMTASSMQPGLSTGKMESQKHTKPSRLINAIQQDPQSGDRKNTARLREIFDEVEETLRGPYSHKKVLTALKMRGIEFELRSFESALYRIRRERKERAQNTQNTAQEIKQPRGTTAHQEIKQPRGATAHAQPATKQEGIVQEIAALATRPDLSLDDAFYAQLRKEQQ